MMWLKDVASKIFLNINGLISVEIIIFRTQAPVKSFVNIQLEGSHGELIFVFRWVRFNNYHYPTDLAFARVIFLSLFEFSMIDVIAAIFLAFIFVRACDLLI